MPHRVIASPADLDAFIEFLTGLKLPVTVEWVQGRDRTGEQNRLQWKWASEAGMQLGETADEVQRRWKLHHGVPILREDSEDFRQFYDRSLKRLPYELKLEAMRFVPVTSEFKVKQMVRFMDAIWKECGEQGIHLTDPDRQNTEGATGANNPRRAA
jgi:hypothetical protein